MKPTIGREIYISHIRGWDFNFPPYRVIHEKMELFVIIERQNIEEERYIQTRVYIKKRQSVENRDQRIWESETVGIVRVEAI